MTHATLASPPVSPPRLRPATLDDYERIARLEAANGLGSMPQGDWRNLWLKNPLWPRLGAIWPMGWALETADGQLVGSLINIPSLYTFQGLELICANGRGWVVDEGFRGFALALMGEYFSQPGADLYINTTVGPPAAPIISALSDQIPQGDFQSTAYFATAYHGLATKALRRKNVPLAGLVAYPTAVALRVKDAVRLRGLPLTPAGIEIAATDRFDTRFDVFWEELVRQNPDKLLSARDSRALSWHFAGLLRQGHLWIFTAVRAGLLRAYCILKRQDPGSDVSRMRLVDYQTLESQVDLLPGLLRVALRRCVAERVCVLEHLGCGLDKMASFDRFAPYRRTLSCWPFYYRAADPALHGLLTRPEAWDASAYDGDASYD